MLRPFREGCAILVLSRRPFFEHAEKGALAPLGILLSWALFLLATSPRSGARNRAAAT